MKKKTALALSLLALLAAGVTFGKVYTDKREKEKIEKELNDILIPEAENKLNTLLLTEQSLQDSVEYYRQQISWLSQDQLISRTDAEVIAKLFSDISNDINKAVSEWNRQYFDMYYEGDGSFNENALPQNAREQILYLQGGMFKQFEEDPTWTIPGYRMEYMVIDRGYNQAPTSGMFPIRLSRPYYREYRIFAATSGYDTYSEELLDALMTSVSEVLPAETRGVWEEGNDPMEQLDAFEQEQLLRTLKCFVEKIDNTRNIINPTTLRKLAIIVDSLLIKADSKNLSAKESTYKEKITKFQSAKFDVSAAVRNQRSLLDKYKSPNAIGMLRQQRTTHK